MTIFSSINAPVVELTDEILARRAGLFYKKRMRLDQLQQVVAVLKDAVTHEEVMVGFFDDAHHELWLSEFDKNFSGVMEQLKLQLPGFIGPEGLVGEKPFERVERVLWNRNKRPEEINPD